MTSVRSIPSIDVFSDAAFPLRVMRVVRQTDATLHGHGFHELVLILGGSGRHATAHGEYALAAGDVFLIRGTTAHGYVATRSLELVNILFSPQPLRLPLDELDLGGIPGYHALFRIEPGLRGARPGTRLGLSPDQLDMAVGIVDALDDELHAHRPGFRFMACSHLMRLIGFLSRCYTEMRSPQAAPVLGISRALSHLDQHFAERVTVAQLAAVAHMSESTFTRRFREAVGRAPIDYLIRKRIGRACAMIRQGEDAKLTTIAMACGFEDGNYFSRQFHRVTGRTPRAYRDAARRGGETGELSRRLDAPLPFGVL